MSAAELTLARWRGDIVEITACGAPATELTRRARDAGWGLPPLGVIARCGAGLALAVRPQRWQLLAPAASGAGFAGVATVVELSAGLAAFFLAGPAVRSTLRRGCRLDLEGAAFPAGTAAATSMAQVAVTVAALPRGFLLLTPASTAQHFEEWLAGAARATGMTRGRDVTVADMYGAASP